MIRAATVGLTDRGSVRPFHGPFPAVVSRCLILVASGLGSWLGAAPLIDIDFSHLESGDRLADGDRVEDRSGNGYHGFWGDAVGFYPVVSTPFGSAVDTTNNGRGHVFLRDGLTGIPDGWDGPAITRTPYFRIDGSVSHTFEAVVNWNGGGSLTNGLMGQTGAAEFWIREREGSLHYVFDDGQEEIRLTDRTISLASAKQDGDWHAVAVVYDADAGEIRAYLDGALIHAFSSPVVGNLGPLTRGNEDFRVGAYNTQDADAFNGLQGRYRIHATALAASELLRPPPVGDAPGAVQVQVEGPVEVGGVLSARYVYTDAQGDPEGDSIFRWFRSEDATFDPDDQEIAGAASRSYVIREQDTGYHLFFQVTPVALQGEAMGMPRLSEPTARILEPGPFPESVPFTSGIGYPVYRIPAIVRANDGTLLAFCEGRASFSDSGNIDLVLRRSIDGGTTWGPLILVQEEGGSAPITIGNPAPVVDRETGHVHLLFTRQNDRVFHTVSTDLGLTWSLRSEITERVKLEEWGWYATGPCHGIQITRGAQAGRLVIPANHRRGADGSDSGAFGAQILYSDDHGMTWNMDVHVDAANGTGPNETTLVELTPPAADGGSRLYINSRDYGSDPGNRSEAFSEDGGSSYSIGYRGNSHFDTPVVQGSLLRFSRFNEGDGENRILFSCPNGASRRNGAIWVSRDEAVSWSAPKPLFPESPRDFAYSDMVKTVGGDLGLLYETDGYGTIRFVRIGEAWIDEVPPPVHDPKPAFWRFGESGPGQVVDLVPGAILDSNPAGHGLHLTAETGSLLYTQGERAAETALAFDGSGGLSLADSATGSSFDFGPEDSVTFEALLRLPPTGASLPGAIIAKNQQPGGEWWLRVQTDGRLAFLWDDGVSERIVSSSSPVNDDAWHHVAAVRDGEVSELRIYVDGALSGNASDTTTGAVANARPLTVGAFNGTADRNLVGQIAWLAVTPRILAPGRFVADRLTADSDLDGLPDSEEAALVGSSGELGSGDRDGDGQPDLLEVALGSDPLIASTRAVVRDLPGRGWVYRRRSDLPWIRFDEQFSQDLVNWGGPPPRVVRTQLAVSSGMDEVTFEAGDPSFVIPLFFRVVITARFP
jgi:sialidase-1